MNSAESGAQVPETESKSIKLRIIEAASSLFDRKGMNDTSVAEIAEEAGISVPVTYQHVRRKSDIMILIMEHFTEKLTGMVQAGLAGQIGAENRLERAIKIFCRLVDEEKVKAVLLYRKSRVLDRAGRDQVMAFEAEQVKVFEDIILEGMASGVFSTEEPNLAAYNIVMIGHTWALKRWHLKRRLSLDEFIQLQTDAVFKMLAPVARPDSAC